MATSPPPLTAENWWEVIPDRNAGAAKLLTRCIELLSWRPDFAMNVLHAYKEFMACKLLLQDYQGNQLEPSIPVYQMWSQHILDTIRYQKDCELLFGKMMHYDPNLYKDYQGRHARVNKTMHMIYERTKNGFVDPIVWNFGPAMPPTMHMQPPPSASHGEDGGSAAKRPRAEFSYADNPYAGYASYQMAPHHGYPAMNNGRFFAKAPIPSKAEKESTAGTVTLQIYKSTDGGAMDNKVTLDRDQQLRSVLDYYRYRCVWQNKRLNLHCTPNELKMGSVENILLSSIHVDEAITLWFRDFKGNTTPRMLRMRENIGDAISDYLQELGIDGSKVVLTHRGNVLSLSSTPLLFQLDHGDVIDIALMDGSKQGQSENQGEEKKEQKTEEVQQR